MPSHILRALLLLLVMLSPAFAEQPQLMHAKHWNESIDPSGWLISEKYDGIRGYWNGKQLLSRAGNPLNPPAWFIENMPNFPLDGELWIGRGKFSEVISVVKNQRAERSETWKKVLFMVFDAPDIPGSFEARHAKLQQWFAKREKDHLRLVKQTVCKGKGHLKAELAKIERRGGEGLMIRQPSSMHIAGRSPALLKVKSWHDTEGKVVGYIKGQGKYTGLMGALVIEMPNGVTFSLGSGFSKFQRQQPPEIGSVVTYRYRGFYKSGKPRFASFVRVRQEL